MPRVGVLKWALWGAAILGVAAVVYIMAQASFKPSQGDGGLKAVAKGEMAKLSLPAEAGPAPATSFHDLDGKPVRVADFKGKVVVLNLWATWCAPCVAEMPTLAKLQAAYVGKPVEVVAVSIDSASALDKAKQFIAQNAPLKFYNDPNMKMPFAMKPQVAGMPTTIIYGPDGIERGRISGGADWAGPDARAVIDHVLAKG
ncbi:MAG: TlpA family protein disulfide reductase [Caulobacteraceae bacterium]|nr:TlpA family protein disulfide reductase [Caulobacteraceae bacterium]